MGNLDTLQEDYFFTTLSEDIVKYQHFQTKSAIEKFRIKDKSFYTLKNYLFAGLSYLKDKRKATGIISQKFYNALDKVIEKHVQPLVPKENERRKKGYNFAHKKEVILPINKIDIIKKPTTKIIDYGVQYGKIIYLKDTEQEASLLLEGIKIANGDAKLVTVEIDEVNEECQK